MEDSSTDVRLVIPGSLRRVQLARLVAAGIGGIAGFDVDEIEDLRIAVDELCVAMLTGGAADQLDLTYRVADGHVEIVGECEYREGARSITLEPLAAQILDTVVDEHEISIRGGTRGRFRLRKSRPAV